MTERVRIPRKTEAYGWVGMWRDGMIGWRTPEFIHANRRGNAAKPSDELQKYASEASRRVYLCKITIEPVLTVPTGMENRSQPITRIIDPSVL